MGVLGSAVDRGMMQVVPRPWTIAFWLRPRRFDGLRGRSAAALCVVGLAAAFGSLGLFLAEFIITERGPALAPPEYEIVPSIVGLTAAVLGSSGVALVVFGILLAKPGHGPASATELRTGFRLLLASILIVPFDAGLVATTRGPQ